MTAIITTIINGVLALCTGIILYKVQAHDKNKEQKMEDETAEREKLNAMGNMLLGLGHEKILASCAKFVERGYITAEEYDDLDKYLYQPYRALGGNGSAERAMETVKALPSIKKEGE